MASKERVSRNSKSKLTAYSVHEIRHLLKKGVALREIARRYGLHHKTVADIRDGKSWRCIPEPPKEADDE